MQNWSSWSYISANGVFYDTTYPPAPTFIFFLEMGSPQSSTVTMARKD